MVDDDDIRRKRLLAGLHDEALRVMRALGAQAVLARRSHVRPDARVFRDRRQVALVAGCAVAREIRNQRQVTRIVAAREPAFVLCALEVIMADVVGAALEQRHRDRHFERLAHDLDVAVEQLILQRLGAGRDDHLAAREQRGHQISKGFSGSRSGFGNQNRIGLDRIGNRARHFELALPDAEAGHCVCEWTVSGEYRIEILH